MFLKKLSVFVVIGFVVFSGIGLSLPSRAEASTFAPAFYHVNDSCFTTTGVANGPCVNTTAITGTGYEDPRAGDLANYPAIQNFEAACAKRGFAECNMYMHYQSGVCADFGGTGGCSKYSGWTVSTSDTSGPNEKSATYGYGASSGSYSQWYALVSIRNSLSASAATIAGGQGVKLSWTASRFVNDGCVIDNGGGTVLASTNGATYTPATHSGSVTLYPSSTTTYTLTCRGGSFDNTGDVATATDSVTVTVIYPDLTALTTAVSANPTVGEDIAFTSTAKNIGSGSAGSFPNVFQIANGAKTATVLMLAANNVSSLASGASAALSGKTATLAAGSYNVRACADTNTSWKHPLDESDTSNDCGGWQAFSVGTPSGPLPNLTALTTSVSANPVADQPISFSSTAKNTGAGSAGSFPNIFQVTNSDGTATVAMVSANSVSSLASGATTALTGTTALLAAGSYQVRACADTNASWKHPLAEADTTDDCGAFRAFVVSSGIDSNNYCDTHPSDPACTGGSGFCAANPSDPSCQGSGFCTTHPSDPSCVLQNPSSNVSALLNADPATVVRGSSIAVTWSSRNASSCQGGGTGFDTKGKVSGSSVVYPLTTTLFTLDCQDADGNHAFDTQVVTVTAPQASITASPTLVRAGDSSVISWSVSGKVDSCTISGPGLSSHSISGSTSESIPAESTYTISCTAGTYHPSASVTVKVVPSFKEI